MLPPVLRATNAVSLQGATGPRAHNVDGTYEPTEETAGGATAYRKRGNADMWLQFHDSNRCGFQRYSKDCIMAIVTTTKGDMDESLLEKREGSIDDDNEYTTWVEYWLEGELVHRSAHVTLKKMPTFASAEAASL